MKQTEILTHATYVNGLKPALYMSCVSHYFRLFHVSNLSVLKFQTFLLMYPGSLPAIVRPSTIIGSRHQGPRIHEQKKFESFQRINSMRETNGNFDSCNSCKRLGTSRSHELHESKFPFVSRIEFIRWKLSNFFGSCIRGQGRGSRLPSVGSTDLALTAAGLQQDRDGGGGA